MHVVIFRRGRSCAHDVVPSAADTDVGNNLLDQFTLWLCQVHRLGTSRLAFALLTEFVATNERLPSLIVLSINGGTIAAVQP